MIVVAGEALVDLILHEDGHVSAVAGGGPYNTARTIGRLGGSVAFLGRLSSDRFGRMLRDGLATDGVHLRWAVTTDDPTSLAVAELDGRGAATYRFHLLETSAPGLELADVLDAIASDPAALHVGTLGLAVEPIAPALAAGVERVSPDTLVMVDPNCRPAVIGDRAGYLERLSGVLARADVVKVSADDMAYLAPGSDAADAARALRAIGAALVLLTDGPASVRAFGASFELEVPVPPVVVVDTVGSGDAFGGAFLARWIQRGLRRGGLADRAAVVDAVEFAVAVAGITSSRAGLDPPHAFDVARLTR